MTREELQAQLDKDVVRGFVEEISPGKYKATTAGIWHSKTEALVSLLLSAAVGLQTRAKMLLDDPGMDEFTFDELVEKELGEVSQAIPPTIGQYL